MRYRTALYRCSIFVGLISFLSVALPCNTFAGELNKEIKLYYASGSAVVDQFFDDNSLAIRRLSDWLMSSQTDSLMTIERIEIKVQTSVDGGVTRNRALRAKRLEYLQDYLTTQFNIPDSVLVVLQDDTMWSELRALVEMVEFDGRDGVIDILDNVPVEQWSRVNKNDKFLTLTDSRLKHLMEYNYGDTYKILSSAFFPNMRYALIRVVYSVPEVEDTTGDDDIEEVEPVEKSVEEVAEEAEKDENPVATQITSGKEVLPRSPILALKTNLVGLGVGVANIGLEFPIKEKFSMDVQLYYSPYTIKRDWKMKFLVVQPEFRFWFGDALKGHFVGVHAHCGLFNVAVDQWSRYQNSTKNPLWGAGIGYGYALMISRKLNLEFNIGVGYASLRYDTFYNVDNGAQYNHTDRGYWGITRAGISFTYVINHK